MDLVPVLVKDINPNGDASLSDFVAFNNRLFFNANDGTSGGELWTSDGTPGGTVRLKDINPGSGNSFPNSFIEFNNRLFFAANAGTINEELWTSDGTEAGTVLLKDINPGSGGSSPRGFTEFNGRLFFSANDGTTGRELWTSDGTPDGTRLFKDINPNFSNLGPSRLTVVGNSLLFVADDGTHGEELWISDGTEAGTVLVKDIFQGSFLSQPRQLTEFNGRLFFTAGDGTTGRELWTSDGTEAGTVLVKDIFPDSFPSRPIELTEVNGRLFFSAFDSISGRELWTSDGTTNGTVQVKDINPSIVDNPAPVYLTEFNGRLFFQAFDGAKASLWTSDGTANGTVIVKEGISPRHITKVGDRLFFSADDGTNGNELWTSDGTTAGTVLVGDINPGSGSSIPSSFTEVDGRVFFNANDGTNGDELWTLAPANGDPVAADDAVTTDEDTPLSGSVLGNNGSGADGDPDGDTLTVTDVNGSAAAVGTEIDLASGALLTVNDDGSFDYNPNDQFEALDDGDTATDTFTYTITDGNGGTDTAEVTVTIEGANDATPIYFSGEKDKTVGGLSFASEDIVFFDGTDFSLAFDGSDVLPRGTALSAFDIISDTEILMSFTKPIQLDGLGRVDDSDVVKFIADAPDALGTTTSGRFELYIDGSDIALNRGSEDIIALDKLENGDLLISTLGDATLMNGFKAKGQDIIRLSLTTTGPNTQASAALHFDGSDVKLSGKGENLSAIARQADQLLFSTTGNWGVSSTQSGRREDAGLFTGTFGSSTSGSFADALAFDGSAFGFNGRLSGLDFGIDTGLML